MSEINRYTPGNKPVLALDIDGVFIIYNRQPPEGYVPFPRQGMFIEHYNPEHGLWINEFMQAFQVVYTSSHQQDSHENIGKILGLPELDWVNYRGVSRPGDDSLNRERRFALETFFAGRPVAWVDDDIEDRDFDWAKQRTDNGNPTLIIHTQNEIGLERSQVDDIHAWYGSLALS